MIRATLKRAALLSLCLCIGFTVFGICAFADSNLPATKLNQAITGVLGAPYKWAGTTAKGFDCSGFTQYVFKKFDISLPHSSKLQASKGTKVAKDSLRPGDLVFFDTGGSGISHVGMYLGNNQFVHSASNEGVVINDLDETYYAKRYVTARRVIGDELYTQLSAEIKAE